MAAPKISLTNIIKGSPNDPVEFQFSDGNGLSFSSVGDVESFVRDLNQNAIELAKNLLIAAAFNNGLDNPVLGLSFTIDLPNQDVIKEYP